ncbi:hypothetical protein BROUX41_001132 [Berkeleyomyces rouxiae]|uniref:uncharacterized protein n=1 Tax=Berkeleyomyces rouxiae TaxID=2035830 RepID=UPI003B817FC0
MNPFPDSPLSADPRQNQPRQQSPHRRQLPEALPPTAPPVLQPLVPQETNPFKLRITQQHTGASSASFSTSASPPRPAAGLAPSPFDAVPAAPHSHIFDEPFAAPLIPAQAQGQTHFPASASPCSTDASASAPQNSDAGPILDPWNDVTPTAPVPQSPSGLATRNAPPPEEGNLIDFEPDNSTPPQPSFVVSAPDERPSQATSADPAPPATPPRHSPRPVDGNETYIVRNITWRDRGQMRTSPILMQNANGPCPLVALVNALIISTPETSEQNLASILIAKEQISLNLLLQAVIHELLSKESSPDSTVPDIEELAEFLKGLHTGMNVNPRFLPTPEQVRVAKRTSLVHVHPVERDDSIPGGFEDSPEMRFYSTFCIPLVHGWLPSKGSLEFEAMERSASSFEAAQVLMSREEEIEAKLSGEGLSEEEQQTLQDMFTIKDFVINWATQLTPTGLDVLTKSTPPNHVCILFRNDHFSTLYRHPDTLQLLALVTDSGFVNHQEVVWESLVDINGEQAEFFSGDFRIVSASGSDSILSPTPGHHAPPLPPRQQTVVDLAGTAFVQETGIVDNRNGSPHSTSQQVDNDLAFALQLQEEENARHRRGSSSRAAGHNSNSLLDTQVLDPTRNHGHGHDYRYGSSLVNPRGVPLHATAPRQLLPASGSPVGRRPVGATAPMDRSEADMFDDEAPPSYEQARDAQAHVPLHSQQELARGGYRTSPVGGLRQATRGRRGDRECVVM